MTVSEARHRYRDEWVALRVLRTNRYDVPLAGDVVVHARDRGVFDQEERAYRMAHPEQRLFVFFAGEPIPEGLAVCLATG